MMRQNTQNKRKMVLFPATNYTFETPLKNSLSIHMVYGWSLIINFARTMSVTFAVKKGAHKAIWNVIIFNVLANTMNDVNAKCHFSNDHPENIVFVKENSNNVTLKSLELLSKFWI